jgi:4'-phosphopantetheinyl transferase
MRTTDDRTPAKVAEPLRDDEIHVWWLDYRREHGRAPLRAVLAAYLGEPPEALVFAEGEHGRPALAAPHDGLAFNWSHSGGRAVLAVARGIAPGIDLERLRPRPRALEIAGRYFCADEAAALAALPPAQRDDAFLALWTAKEAVLKATGRGLAFGLDRLHFAMSPTAVRLLRLDGDDAGAWQLHPLDPDPGHVATLAWRGPPRRIRRRALAADG